MAFRGDGLNDIFDENLTVRKKLIANQVDAQNSDTFVLKSGDTMTGDLEIEKNSPTLLLQDTGGDNELLTLSTGQLQTTGGTFIIRSKDDNGIYLTTSTDSVTSGNYGIYVNGSNGLSLNECYFFGASNFFQGEVEFGEITIFDTDVFFYGQTEFNSDVVLADGDFYAGSHALIDNHAYIHPVSSSDASAPNNSIYYSTTASKLVYKNSSGVVNNLY